MHKFIMDLFSGMLNAEKSLRIVCVFFMMMLSLYWIQNLIGASWAWMTFIAPSLDQIINTADNMFPLNFDFWGKTFEIKYFTATIIVLLIILLLKLLSMFIEFLRDFYLDIYFNYKKAKEDLFNEGLKTLLEFRERKTNEYFMYIKARISKKHAQKAMFIDIKEQNKLMNDFITERTHTKPVEHKDGFLYKFENFDKIDSVIDLIYRLKNSPSPLIYFVCIQSGDDLEQLDWLIGLESWNKILITADTLYRYMCNEEHRYITNSVGVFQKGDGENTLEVHEVLEDL